MVEIQIIGFWCKNGNIQPLAYANRQVSNKEAKRIANKFKREDDFVCPVVIEWQRLFSTKEEAKKLPRID